MEIKHEYYFLGVGLILILFMIELAIITDRIVNSLDEVEDTMDIIMYTYEKSKLYNKSNFEKVTINGVYFPDDEYYCVWARNRDPEQVSKTEAHEYCHHLAHTQTDHICGWYEGDKD